MAVVIEFAASRGQAIPPEVEEFRIGIEAGGGRIVSITVQGDELEVAWLPADADPELEPFLSCFGGADLLEAPIDAGLADLEDAATADPTAEIRVLPDFESLTHGAIPTVEPSIAVITDGYVRVSDVPLSVSPIVALQRMVRASRSVAATISALAASIILLDAADGCLDGVIAVGRLAGPAARSGLGL